MTLGAGDYPATTWFEGGINLTEELGGVACFSTFMAITSASFSLTSAMKDFSIGSLPLCAIDVSKTPDRTEVCNNLGGDVTYTYVISNNSFVELDFVAVDDNATPGDDTDDVTVFSGTIPAGGSETVTHTFTLSGTGDVTNIVTVTATDPTSGFELVATATSTVTTATCALDVAKSPNVPEVCSQNSAVTYTYTVTNTGTVALSNVNLVDDKLGDIDGGAGFALAVGAGQTFTASTTLVPVGALPEAVVNVVTATGEALGATATDSATATVTIHKCSIDVTKNCTDAVGEGNPITFDGVITNTGTTPLTGITLVDTNDGSPSPQTLVSNATLTLGATLAYNGSYTPDQSFAVGHTNTVNVSGTAFASTAASQAVSNSAQAPCDIITNPRLLVTKQCFNGGFPPANSPITFSGTVTNDGDVTLNNVSVFDDRVGGNVLIGVTLTPGQSTNFTGSYIPIFTWNKNTVTANGTDAISGQSAPPVSDSAVCQGCPFVDNPAVGDDSPTSPGSL